MSLYTVLLPHSNSTPDLKPIANHPGNNGEYRLIMNDEQSAQGDVLTRRDLAFFVSA